MGIEHPALHAKGLSLGYPEGAAVVDNLDLDIPDGLITALVGANGSGKSTILKAMARILHPRAGAVYLDGKAIHKTHSKEVARQLGILPQNPEAPEGLAVRELVGYGRFPYQSGFGAQSAEDKRMIDWALQVTSMEELAARPIGHLSGGQRQRAWIAMALAQDTRYLLLDEPTTFLDIAYQLEVLHLIRKLNLDQGRTIVMVVHDLNQATRYAHHVVAIAHGKVARCGSPDQVVTADMVQEVFGVLADIVPDPRGGGPLCIPFDVVPGSHGGQANGMAPLALGPVADLPSAQEAKS